MFNVISYNKGGAFFNMLIKFVGFEIWRNWMRYHKKRFSYKSIETSDQLGDLTKFLPNNDVNIFINIIYYKIVFKKIKNLDR
jgi:hypothetical protein